ncbi:non-muscle caldesmon-like isoform X4 [Heptranchias perlo]|uniref:non-muscle caldesmon-like isoform X4 n=1 Tax=Heptranchias perlo TaxID=212740 RepID=UPI0035598C77
MRKTFKLRLKSNCNGNVEDKNLTGLHTTEGELYCVSTSLARQRSMEDDEEFEKARRRRYRQNSSISGNEDIAEEQHTSENSTVFNEQEETSSPHLEDETVAFAEMLRRREEDRIRHQRETLQSLKLAKFTSETEVGRVRESKQEHESKKPEMKEASTDTQRKKSDEDYSKKTSTSPLKQEKETNNSAASTQNHSNTENTCSQSPLSPIHTTRVFISLGKPKEVKSPTRLKTQLSLENNKCYQEEKSSTKIANDCPKSQARVTEFKANERGEHEKTRQEPFKRESNNKEGTQDVKRASNIVTEVQHQKKGNITDHPSSNDVPFRRFSPRAISFRIANPEVTTQPFQRSASLRIQSRSPSAKIDGIFEQYVKAVQRSDSIKSKKSPSNYLSRPLEGVASKRCVFEKDDTQDASTRYLTTKKDTIGLYVRVAVRINKWVSRAQESRKALGCKDIRPGDVANKRSLWENRADSVDKKELHSNRSNVSK